MEDKKQQLNDDFKFFIKAIKDYGELFDLDLHNFMEGEYAFYDKRFDDLKKTIEENLAYKADYSTLSRLLNILKDSKCVDSYGGEGQGDNYYSVYHFPEVDMYIKFYGYYQSYNGSEYQDCYLVEPKEVTKTEYFQIN